MNTKTEIMQGVYGWDIPLEQQPFWYRGEAWHREGMTFCSRPRAEEYAAHERKQGYETMLMQYFPDPTPDPSDPLRDDGPRLFELFTR